MNARKLTLSAVGVALLSSACCTVPALVAALGLGGSVLGAVFEPYRPIFIGLSLGLIGWAAWSIRRSGGAACCIADRNKARWTAAMLAVAATLSLGLMAYPAVQAARLHHGVPGAEAGLAATRLHVEGMTCAGCAVEVQRVLEQTPEVQRADVDLESGEVTVYAGDGVAQLDVGHLAEVVTRETPYQASAEVEQ